MKAFLRPRVAALLALLALPFILNSCSPYYYGDAAYVGGSTYYSDSYYRPAPVVASSLYISSSSYRCNSCRYSPCRCNNYRSHYRRPVVYAPSYHRCNSC